MQVALAGAGKAGGCAACGGAPTASEAEDAGEDAGQQEMLNWMCLAGVLSELQRKPEIVEFQQTYVHNSSKCLAVARP